MLADPAQVGLNVWFVPEQGIESAPVLLQTVVGVRAAVQVALKYIADAEAEEGPSPHGYEDMYGWSKFVLEQYCARPMWSCAVPVCYGTLLIA